MEDKLLVEGLRQKDEVAFNMLYVKYEKLLRHIILDIIKNKETTEDILQIVFMKLWNKIDTFRDGNLKYFLITIAKNESYNYLKFKERENNIIDKYETYFTVPAFKDLIWEAVRKYLSPLEQKIIVRHYIYKMNFLYIDNSLNMKNTNCFNIYKKALTKLEEKVK